MSFGLLVDFKVWATSLGIDFTGWDDGQLQEILDDATAWIRSFTNRFLSKAEFTQEFDGNGKDSIILREYPIILLKSVSLVGSIQVTPLSLTTAEIVQDEEAGILYLEHFRIAVGPRWPVGRQNVKIVFDGGFDPVPAEIILAERKVALINLVTLNPEEFQRKGIKSERVGDHRIQFERGASFQTKTSKLVGSVSGPFAQMILTFEAQLMTVLNRFRKLSQSR